MNREQWQVKRCQHDALPHVIGSMAGSGYPVGIFEITVDSRFGLTPANDEDESRAVIYPTAERDDAGSCCDWSRPEVNPT